MLDYSKLIGIPYLKGGRDEKGLDCYGLCMYVYKIMGIELPEYDSPDENSLIHQLIFQGKELFEKIDKPSPFCLAPFVIRPPFVTHIGIVLENKDDFLHILRKKRSIIERLSNQFWSRRIEGFYRWKNFKS